MKRHILENKIKLIYKQTNSELTSICISLDAGAVKEKEHLGIAHATEHMVYKGTKNRSESQINKELNNIFGFQNAMTNFPYVIYYGTLLNEDFEQGIELFSDILINPIFDKKSFCEEIEVIKQELEEWDEETEQYCEDKMFYNAFDNRRIKYPIIGRKSDLDNMSLENIVEFYEKNYFPENTSITIVSNLEIKYIKEVVNRYFLRWKNKCKKKIMDKVIYEKPKNKVFIDEKQGSKISRIEIVFPIDNLNVREIKMLRLFNEYFGEGVNSVLYDNLRTKNLLVYDVLTKIQNESHMKLYKITLGTSKENAEKAVDTIKRCIDNLSLEDINDTNIENKLFKKLKMKKLFREEKSIFVAKELATYETMFGNAFMYEEEYEADYSITFNEVIQLGIQVLKNMTVQYIN